MGIIKFNGDHIIVGQIKQLLRKINLPHYDNGNWSDSIQDYADGNEYLNKTKNLIIKSNIYDTYTHEYLGEYLRYCRDRLGINLMSMYNCFSNVICNNLDLNLEISKTKSNNQSKTDIQFYSTDKNYKIYMLPVKLNKEYTIALSTGFGQQCEVFCGLYGAYLNKSSEALDLIKTSYKKYSNLSFNQPFSYSTSFELEEQEEKIKKLEPTLKLFIKMPTNVTTSITVLEGNYLHFNDSISTLDTGIKTTNNKSVINFDYSIVKETPEQLIAPVSLLKLNTGVSYPIADRLVEFLTGNAISNQDVLTDNVKRVHEILKMNNNKISMYGVYDLNTRNAVYTTILEQMDNQSTLINNVTDYVDITGYIDTFTQKLFIGDWGDGNAESVNSIDLYKEIYKDSKVYTKGGW